eukprot:10891018-Ditylum_brightwellii.AAC.1
MPLLQVSLSTVMNHIPQTNSFGGLHFLKTFKLSVSNNSLTAVSGSGSANIVTTLLIDDATLSGSEVPSLPHNHDSDTIATKKYDIKYNWRILECRCRIWLVLEKKLPTLWVMMFLFLLFPRYPTSSTTALSSIFPGYQPSNGFFP